MVEVEDYNLLAPLGTGVSGQVYVAKKKEDDKLYALKFIDRFYKDQQQEELVIMALEQEVNAIEMVDSDRVIKSTECFTTENFFVIVMEYCQNGDLLKYVQSKGRLQEEEAMNLFAQILDGIKAVHSKNLIHRDIKPENLLLDDNFSIKIGDFGASIFYQKDALHDNVCGTYYYMAPELENYEEYDFSVDLWGIGCVFFFLLTGRSPFSYCTSQLQIYNCIQQFCTPQLDVDCLISEHVRRESLPQNHNIQISKEVKDLISKMLRVNPKDRICYSDILMHAAFKKYKNCPSVKDLISKQKNYKEIYQSQASLTKLQLTTMSSLKKHDFSPQKQKQLLLNSSLNTIPSICQLNSPSEKRQQYITCQDIDDILMTARQESGHQIPLIKKESEFFFFMKKDSINEYNVDKTVKDTPDQTPIDKIPRNLIKIEKSPKDNYDLSQSQFTIDSDEFSEDDNVSVKIQQYSNNPNIMTIKNKISSDPNSPNYRSIKTITDISNGNTPQNSYFSQKQALSQFSDISPSNFKSSQSQIK